MDYQQFLREPLVNYAHECHAACVELIKNDDFRQQFEFARIARGYCEGINAQHSWIVAWEKDDPEIGNVYAGTGIIIDPTAWSYIPQFEFDVFADVVHTIDGIPRDEISFDEIKHLMNPKIDVYTADNALYQPHGNYTITYHEYQDKKSYLSNFSLKDNLKSKVKRYDINPNVLNLMYLVESDYLGNDIKEKSRLIDVLIENGNRGLIPIDIVGMMTDLNPGGLYLNAMDQRTNNMNLSKRSSLTFR